MIERFAIGAERPPATTSVLSCPSLRFFLSNPSSASTSISRSDPCLTLSVSGASLGVGAASDWDEARVRAAMAAAENFI